MGFFEWNAKYSVGIERFDEQHKKLVGMVNDLYEAMNKGQGNEVVGRILGELISYTKTHFAAEEQLMHLHSYPEYAAHKAEHDKLTKQALELQSQFKDGKTTVTLATGTFLKDWLTKHISGTDKKYTEHLHSRGVK